MGKNYSFLKEICSVAIPVALQCMLQSSFSIVDEVMIGQLGSVSIAAVGFAAKFSSIFTVVLGAVAAVCGIMVAQYIGGNDEKEALRGFNLNLYIATLLGAVFFAASFFFPKQLMAVYSEDVATVGVAARYLKIVAFSYVPLSMNTCVAVLFRCYDKAKIPLYISGVAAVVNTVLNYILIFGKLNVKPLGVEGAAIATVSSAVLSTVLTIVFLVSLLRKTEQSFTFSPRLTKMSAKDYLVIFIPIFVNEFLWSIGENIYAGIYGHIGTKSCAAMTLTNPIQGLLIGGLSGIAQAAGIMIGKRLGNKDYEAAYKDSKKLMLYGFIGSMVLALLLIVLRGLYVNIYQVEDEVKLIGSRLLLIFAVVSPIKVQNMILGGGILRSGGRTKIVMYIDMIGTWLIGVPVGFITAFTLVLPITWVYFLLSMEEAVRLIISIVVFRRRSWIQTI